MRTKGIWGTILFALIVVFLFAYIFNLMPSKVNRLYTCKVANISKEKIVDEIIVKIDGTINKSFLKKTVFSGDIIIGKEKYKCEKVEFTKNITLIRSINNNKYNWIVFYFSSNEKEVMLLPLTENYIFKEEEVIVYPYTDINKIKREYYEVIKKMNGI
ncbi:hypothetical protein [Oceanirhabdus sp. W0125-5]|uniref:hypothetical protein n=1 Tax=Oceanirhabdus sp. W0125-5 TaxID=2999116 RepID=UPI0022F2A64D|nr:hypothetical protein [Oceanirhabdus sp. W0125-5]WBW97438.1 hypothetical protein OW730_00860 [Oceanirhabdus sp. W0125-5]